MTLETLEQHLEETLKAIDAIARPRMDFGRGLEGVEASRRVIQEWEASNPEAQAQYLDLCSRVGPLEREIAEAKHARGVQERVLKALDASGAGDRALLAAVSAKRTEALEAAQEWLTQKRTWLVLLGGTGTGKTVAAVWAMREAARQAEPVAFRTAAALSRMSGFNEGAVELERLQRVSLLVVDDVGAEAQTSWGQGLLSELLDARHQGFRRTIITSNLGQEAFKQRIGERLVDRIREDGRVVMLGGRTLRMVR